MSKKFANYRSNFRPRFSKQEDTTKTISELNKNISFQQIKYKS
jgi:hypothetical protein